MRPILLGQLFGVDLKISPYGTDGRLLRNLRLFQVRSHVTQKLGQISTRRMAIANGTCVSFCNQPKAHYLATSRESRQYVFTGASIWLRQESPRHILASPGYARGTIAVNVTWIETEFNACQTPRSMYPSIFNRFWDIASYWSKIFIPHLCLTAPQGWPCRNFAKILIHIKLEWMGYRVVKKAWQYVQPFWYNTSVWQTDRRTSSL